VNGMAGLSESLSNLVHPVNPVGISGNGRGARPREHDGLPEHPRTKNNVRTGGLPVLTLGHDWLPPSERFTNFFNLAFFADVSRMSRGEFFVSGIEPAGAEPLVPPIGPSNPVINPVKHALVLKDLLENGTYASQADLAEHLGLSRSRVTQTLNLLKLAPEILDALLNLSDDQFHLFSERRLRPFTQIASHKRQTRVFRKLFRAI